MNNIDVSAATIMRGTKKFPDVAPSGRAAIVIDEVLPPVQPRGIEVRGEADAVPGPPALIRIRRDAHHHLKAKAGRAAGPASQLRLDVGALSIRAVSIRMEGEQPAKGPATTNKEAEP